MSRLSLLKSKEKELINESVICYSLINQVLLKINSSIKQLEAEQNKSDFRSVYLSTLCLTDQLNEKLVEINLELEDLIVDKQIDTSELDSSQIYLSSKTATPKVLNIDKDCLADDNTISKAAKFNNPHRNENKTLKVNPLKKEKLKFEKNIVLDEPDDDVSICNQPASFVPATQPLTLASLLNQSKSSNIHTKNSPKSSNIPSRVVLGNTDGLSQLNSRQEVNYVENMAYKSGKPTNSGSLHNDVRQRKTTSKTWLNAKGNQTYISESKEDDDYLITQDTDQTNFISNVCPRNQKSKASSEISTYPTKKRIERELYQTPHHRGTLHSDWENIRHNKYEHTGARGVSQDYQTLRENAMNVAYGFSKGARSVYQEEIARESRPSASQCNDEDATAKEISIRKVLEFLTQSNNNRPRRGRARVSEQKRAIDIGPPGFKKFSIATISTNEAHKSLNIVSTTTTDSYDSYESDRILDESNFDKDLSTEKQNVSSCISERVNQVDCLAESVPVKDCEIEPRNKTDQSVTSCTAEAERYEEDLRRIPAEIQVPDSNATPPPPPSPKVRILNEDRCIVTHAKSPQCFYIITATATENINDYDRFHEELHKYCESNSRQFSSKEEIAALKATYYCCYSEIADCNYNWFRCKIIDWLSDDETNINTVRVLGVDDGFENDITIHKLRDYPQTNVVLPEMAVKCRLRNLYPPKSTKDRILEEWPQASVDFFQDLIQNSQINLLYVTDVHETAASDWYEVDLCNNHRVSLSKVMVEMELAVIIESDTDTDTDVMDTDHDQLVHVYQLINESDHQLLESEFMKEQIMQAQGLNTKSDEHQNPLDNLDDCKAHLTKAICDHLEGGYQPKDHTRLCRFTQVDGERCFKGDHCHFEHKLPDPDGWTTDRIEAFTITHQIDRPKIGHRLSIMVTFIKSVCRLYAHVKPSKTNRQIYSASKIIYTASQFSRYINKPENINALRKFKILRAEGQLVIATESPSDNKWYRARIISIYSEDEIHMFFIDYGDVCTVSLNQLREIKFEHLGLFGPEQINSSIKQLEPEQNKSDFRSVYLSTLFLTDQLNEKLVEINLELEDLILDKQINTSELENCHAESYQY